jgi:hypothetical protein
VGTKNCIAGWIVYLLGFNLYIWTYGDISPTYSRLFYYALSSGLITCCIIDILRGVNGEVHKIFLASCLGGVAINFVFLFAYYAFGVDNYKYKLVSFNGIELITAVFVFISGQKRGLFKHEKPFTLP